MGLAVFSGNCKTVRCHTLLLLAARLASFLIKVKAERFALVNNHFFKGAVYVYRCSGAYRLDSHSPGPGAHGRPALAGNQGDAPGLADGSSRCDRYVGPAGRLCRRPYVAGLYHRHRHSDHRFWRHPDSAHLAAIRRHGDHPIRHAEHHAGSPHPGDHHRVYVRRLHRGGGRFRHPGRPGRAAAPFPWVSAAGGG